MEFVRHHVQFFTAVCYEWLHLLKANEAKKIIIDALSQRVARRQAKVGAYVIMPNHVHIIWRIESDIRPSDFQRDFLKFTARELIHLIRSKEGEGELEK